MKKIEPRNALDNEVSYALAVVYARAAGACDADEAVAIAQEGLGHGFGSMEAAFRWIDQNIEAASQAALA